MISIPNTQIKKFSNLFKVNYEIVTIKLKQEISVDSIHYFSHIHLLKYYLIFFKDWFYIFLLITRNFFNHKSIDKNLSILFNFSEENINRLNTTKHFEEFWIKGPFQQYTKNSSFAVINNNYSFINKKFISYKNIDLIFVLNLNQREKFKILFVHILNFIKFLETLFLNRKFLLLGKDISRLSLYESNKNKFKDINIFINANNYKHTIISFNKINKLKTYFCYYSINNTPIIYDKNINGPKLNYNKYYQHLFINYHLIWNKYHSSSLDQLGLKFGKKIITKPYLYYLPEIKKQNKKKNIVIFDVEPYKDVNKNISYYNYQNCINFIEDIIDCFPKKNNYQLILKHKSRSSKAIEKFDNRYSEYLNKNKNQIKIIEREYNVYNLIDSAIACINFPYTSTASIAQSLGVKTIYYDPTGSIINQQFGVKVIKGKNNLIKYVKKIMSPDD